MNVTTADPVTPGSNLPTPRRQRRRLGLIGPMLALAVAGLAVGRFLFAGESRPTEVAHPSSRLAQSTDLASLQAATVSQPESAKAWLAYGVAALRTAISTSDPSYYAVARAALDRAGQIAPDAADTLAARAILSLSLHDFAAALPLAEQAAATNPYSTTALGALVDARVENGDYQGAEHAARQLLDAGPGVAAYSRVSYLRQLSGDIEGARTAMQQAVASASPGSDRAVVETYLGDISLESGMLDEAASDYEHALVDQPKSVAAALGKARVMIARGTLVEAASLLDGVVARSPQPAAALLRGELAVLQGDQAAADSAFALVDANEQILRSQGVVTDLESALYQADHGRPTDALASARAAYDARHTVFTADAVAWALARSNRATEAVPYAEEAVAGGLLSPAVRIHVAFVFDAIGDTTRARAELETAVRSSPWLALSARPVARDLASRLAVTLPEGWTP